MKKMELDNGKSMKWNDESEHHKDYIKLKIWNYLLNDNITDKEKLYLFDIIDGILLEENYELGSYIIKSKMRIR